MTSINAEIFLHTALIATFRCAFCKSIITIFDGCEILHKCYLHHLMHVDIIAHQDTTLTLCGKFVPSNHEFACWIKISDKGVEDHSCLGLKQKEQILRGSCNLAFNLLICIIVKGESNTRKNFAHGFPHLLLRILRHPSFFIPFSKSYFLVSLSVDFMLPKKGNPRLSQVGAHSPP